MPTALSLAGDSQEVLKMFVEPLHAMVHCEQCLLLHRPEVRQLLGLPLGDKVQLEINGVAADHRCQVSWGRGLGQGPGRGKAQNWQGKGRGRGGA